MYSGRIKPYYAALQDKRRRAMQSANPKTVKRFHTDALLWFDEKYYNDLNPDY